MIEINGDIWDERLTTKSSEEIIDCFNQYVFNGSIENDRMR